MTLRVTDLDRGFEALMQRLERLAHGVRVTCGVHEDEGAEKHDEDTSVAEVATFVEFGTDRTAPRSFVRAPLDEHRSDIEGRIVDAAAKADRELEPEFAAVGEYVAELMRDRVPVESGALREAITARVEQRS
jgi:hypothetical protein